MKKLITSNGFPNYVFIEKYDVFMIFEFTKLLYEHEELFTQCLRNSVQTIGNKKEIFIGVFDEEEYYMKDTPITDVKIDLLAISDTDWHESNSLNEQQKYSVDYYLNTHPEWCIYGLDANWVIYCDRLFEICVLGLKKEVADNFNCFRENLNVFGFKNHEEFFKAKDWLISKFMQNTFKEVFISNYPI